VVPDVGQRSPLREDAINATPTDRSAQEAKMNQPSNANRLRRAVRTLTVAFALMFALAAPALASVTSEQQEGAQTLSAVHQGKLKASGLTSTQYEHVGEYLMGQALGSTASHERMNTLMGEMMGSSAVDQMHVYLGQRYLGNNAQIPGRYAPMYGLMGMMTGYRSGSIASMMSGYLNTQSQSTGSYGTMMGSGNGSTGYYGTQTSASSSDGWPTGAIVATAVLAALLLGGLVALVVPAFRRRSGRPPRGGPASTPAR
jgi:preprotein translocase subunit SecG